MANNSFNDYSIVPATNADIAGTSIAVGCPPADVGVYMRTLLAQIAYNVQGTPGLFAATWHVGTLTATTANVTNLSITNFTPTTITASGAITGASLTTAGAITGATLATSGAVTASGAVTGAALVANGNLVIGSSAAPVTNGTLGLGVTIASGVVQMNSGGQTLTVGITTASGTLAAWFTGGASLVGTITTAAGSTSYNTTSDERLKVRIGTIEYLRAADVIEKLAAVWFSWRDGNNEPSPGFFAQQVYKICPYAVTRGRGNPGDHGFVPWAMDASKLMPFVIAYIQGLGRRVTDLERTQR